MHSEGDNWHCVPAESRREYSDQSGAEDKNLNDLQADNDKNKKKNFSIDCGGFVHVDLMQVLAENQMKTEIGQRFYC